VSNDKQAIVTIKNGKLEGYIDNGLYVFKGIPYAAPPVGELRWMPPQPVKPWSGVRPAKEYGGIAPQSPMMGGIIPQNNQPQAEDCLFLNVFTPGLDNAKRPVMVWIHGGAFTIGAGSDPMYDSDKLPRRGNIVLVSINYRLGMLGFLRLKDATGGKIPATGNEGLMDQVAALKWVKENIADFGGDPKNVTVFGESAGGMSIGCLMAMPSAKGLFQKAILESGVGSTAVPLKESNAGGEQFLKVAGINKDDVNAIRGLTPAQLLEIEMKMRTMGAGPGEAQKITATTPVVDGEIIPDMPNEMARKGYCRDILAIIGNNLEEWKLFSIMQPGFKDMSEEEMLKRVEVFMPAADASRLVAAYRKAREKRGEAVSPAEILNAISTDIMFRIPSLELVEAQQNNKQRVYSYLFTWKSPVMGGVLGACHGLEVGFVFGNNNDMFCGSGPEADKLVEQIQDAWLAFARTGNPSCKSLGDWPVYGKERMTMMLGKDSHVEAAPYEDERSAWDTVKRQSYLVI
jgi:para-nitrobenzyl esterase